MRFSFVLVLTFAWGILLGQRFTPQALAQVNSMYDEQNPVLTPYGDSLFFTVAGHPRKVGEGQKPIGDIWFSRWEGTRWSIPIHAGKSINSQEYNAIISFSPDGQTMFLFNHYGAQGQSVTTQGISYSIKSKDEWCLPVNIKIPYFLNKSQLISGQLTNNGKILDLLSLKIKLYKNYEKGFDNYFRNGQFHWIQSDPNPCCKFCGKCFLRCWFDRYKD